MPVPEHQTIEDGPDDDYWDWHREDDRAARWLQGAEHLAHQVCVAEGNSPPWTPDSHHTIADESVEPAAGHPALRQFPSNRDHRPLCRISIEEDEFDRTKRPIDQPVAPWNMPSCETIYLPPRGASSSSPSNQGKDSSPSQSHHAGSLRRATAGRDRQRDPNRSRPRHRPHLGAQRERWNLIENVKTLTQRQWFLKCIAEDTGLT
ncbi:unnamed protein product [Polarella glacialis]|uniref:Uncharacterized protein n=1 Tax=Polarella glacialis TaxID=89957 RepID=A0A813FMS0_POLGL|nr:unnamed protein product [Polarella glacialis]